MTKIQYYPSNIVGTTILNAVTGKPYDKCYVGSVSEKYFFRVIDSTGFYNHNHHKPDGNRISNKLFYDNKEQYIEHRVNYK